VTVTAGEPGVASPGGTAPDDPVAFGDWVRPHLRTLANIVARLAPLADRDDVVQDVLARAWVKRRLFDPSRGTPAAWLYAIAADQAGKARRRGARRGLEPAAAAVPAAVPVEAPRDSRLDVERALVRLTDRQRLAVECHYFVGLSIAETAAVMGCAEGTVKSTLADARNRLRPMLEVRS
jgi:RNA polymerase sigma factor (sigma-70 family)